MAILLPILPVSNAEAVLCSNLDIIPYRYPCGGNQNLADKVKVIPSLYRFEGFFLYIINGVSDHNKAVIIRGGKPCVEVVKSVLMCYFDNDIYPKMIQITCGRDRIIMRYYSLNTFFRQRFGCRVYKVPVHAGFTCPNRDGTISNRGCIFCYNPSFSPVAEEEPVSLREQITKGKARIKHKEGHKYLIYFQPFTNTYAPVERLRSLYEEALKEPDVVGLSIATRPDCVPDEVLDLLEEYASSRYIWLELGLQSAHDRTLCLINRGHRREDFEDAVARSRGRGILLCAHVILGLPGESREDMVETALFLSSQEIQGVKIHHLQVIENTPLAEMYRRGEVRIFTFREYVDMVCDFLEHLRPDLVIHRLMGDVLDYDSLLAPRWNVGKAQVIGAIEKELEFRNSYQGSKCPGEILSDGGLRR